MTARGPPAAMHSHEVWRHSRDTYRLSAEHCPHTGLMFRPNLKIRHVFCLMQKCPSSPSSLEFLRKRSSTNAARRESLPSERRPRRMRPLFWSRPESTLLPHQALKQAVIAALSSAPPK